MHAPSGSRASMSASAWGRKRERNSDAVYGNKRLARRRVLTRCVGAYYVASSSADFEEQRKCKQLANRCRKLLSTIEERQPELQRNEKLREEVDALTKCARADKHSFRRSLMRASTVSCTLFTTRSRAGLNTID